MEERGRVPRASRERTHALPAPGIGVYSALTAKLMTARDPSRCSSGPSRPRVPEVNTHREKREEQSKNPFENTSTFMYICSRARWKMGLGLRRRRRRRRLLSGTLGSRRLWGPSSLGLGLGTRHGGDGGPRGLPAQVPPVGIPCPAALRTC